MRLQVDHSNTHVIYSAEDQCRLDAIDRLLEADYRLKKQHPGPYQPGEEYLEQRIRRLWDLKEKLILWMVPEEIVFSMVATEVKDRTDADQTPPDKILCELPALGCPGCSTSAGLLATRTS